MAYQSDTNIRTCFTNAQDPLHPVVSSAVRTLLQRGEVLYYTQQIRREFWSVCTRPAVSNGLGYGVAETQERLAEIDAVFHRLPDRPESGPEWDRLMAQYQVMGRAAHDAQIVASMLANGISHLLTLNTRDFARYSSEITIVDPRDD